MDSPVPDGEYNFFDDLLDALRGAETEQLQRFREVAVAAASGAISEEETVAQAASIRPEFGHVAAKALSWGIPGVIAPAIAIYIAWVAMKHSDKTGNDILLEMHAQTAVATQGVEVDAKLAADLDRLIAMQSTSPPQPQMLPKQSTSQLSASGGARTNRHQRRKAEAFGRKYDERKP